VPSKLFGVPFVAKESVTLLEGVKDEPPIVVGPVMNVFACEVSQINNEIAQKNTAAIMCTIIDIPFIS
jgi:hypothetical protein